MAAQPSNRQQRRQAEREARKKGRHASAPEGAAPDLSRALQAHAAGRTEEAEAEYRRILTRRPDDGDALRLLGLLLDHRQQLLDAVNGINVGSPIQGRLGEAAYHTAVALATLGRTEEAEQALRRTLADDATHAPALVRLAELRRSGGHLDEAGALARRAVAAADSPAAHRQLGLALNAQERVVEAATSLQRAAELLPNDGETWMNLGHVQLSMGEVGRAFDAFTRARDLEPRAPTTHNNVAVTAQRLGRYDEAVQASTRAIELAPDNLQFRYNRAFSLLGSGRLREGWEELDHGFAVGARAPNREFTVPRWDGAPMPDGALLIWREQGVGDEIRLASCYEDAGRQAGRLVIETDPRLTSLFSRSFPEATVRPQRTGPAEPDFDAHSPAGSLPRHLRPSIESFPPHDGYLSVDPRRAARFRERLDDLGPGLKVGVSWRSLNLGVDRLSHYTVLSEWEPVLRTPDVVFVNLQYGVPEQVQEELAALQAETGHVVHRWDDVDYTDDFEAVAALISELDVVVGVGTTPALLAGALGRPTSMLALPDPMAFGQERFPWMPSLRRYPRGWDEPWTGAMERIAADLRSRTA